MEKTLIDEIESYCTAAGVSPATLCVRALGNSRFFERLQRKAMKLDESAGRLRTYMRDNPPPPPQPET